jgi:hypothetical protein
VSIAADTADRYRFAVTRRKPRSRVPRRGGALRPRNPHRAKTAVVLSVAVLMAAIGTVVAITRPDSLVITPSKMAPRNNAKHRLPPDQIQSGVRFTLVPDGVALTCNSHPPVAPGQPTPVSNSSPS